MYLHNKTRFSMNVQGMLVSLRLGALVRDDREVYCPEEADRIGEEHLVAHGNHSKVEGLRGNPHTPVTA